MKEPNNPFPILIFGPLPLRFSPATLLFITTVPVIPYTRGAIHLLPVLIFRLACR